MAQFFSAAVSLSSITTVGSRTGRTERITRPRTCRPTLSRQGLDFSHIGIYVRKEIGFDRMRTNFWKLLRLYAGDLKAENSHDCHRAFVEFVSSHSTNIKPKLFSKVSIDNGDAEARVPEPVEAALDFMARRNIVEDYVHMTLSHVGATDYVDYESNDLGKLSDDSDQISVAEGDGEEEPYDDSLRHLKEMECFILRVRSDGIVVRLYFIGIIVLLLEAS